MQDEPLSTAADKLPVRRRRSGPSAFSGFDPAPAGRGTRIFTDEWWPLLIRLSLRLLRPPPLRPSVFHEARKRIFINRPWPSAAAMKF